MIDGESSPIRAQLQAAFPEAADAEGKGVSIPEDELKDLGAYRQRRVLPLSKQLTDAYRLGWGIETRYRKSKNNFLPKSNTNVWRKRVFQFGLAILYRNMWLAANSRKAEAFDGSVKDDQGRYRMTAHRFMMCLFEDLEAVAVGEVEDLPEISELVREHL